MPEQPRATTTDITLPKFAKVQGAGVTLEACAAHWMRIRSMATTGADGSFTLQLFDVDYELRVLDARSAPGTARPAPFAHLRPKQEPVVLVVREEGSHPTTRKTGR